jgi:hypothetical protein
MDAEQLIGIVSGAFKDDHSFSLGTILKRRCEKERADMRLQACN